MLLTTLPRLRCPNCVAGNAGALALRESRAEKKGDVLFGTLACGDCGSTFPILAGVAVLVGDVGGYLAGHAKGVSSFVPDAEIPEEHREAFLAAKAEIEAGLMEEDIESERVNALYFLTHYVRAGKSPWWKPKKNFSPEIDRLVRRCWNQGPFAKIDAWTKRARGIHAIELGCGAGGLARVLAPRAASYLGFDVSFASVALARHVNLGAPYALSLQIPQDLFHGPLTGRVPVPKPLRAGQVDFVVAEIEAPPAAPGTFDLAVALNTIDVIEDPLALPGLQRELLREGGSVIVSSPYLWEERVVAEVRETVPAGVRSSAEAVERLYEEAGFTITKRLEHVPWLFLEHFRKVGLYSVHLLMGRKEANSP